MMYRCDGPRVMLPPLTEKQNEDLALLVAAHLGAGEGEGAGLTEPLLVSRYV